MTVAAWRERDCLFHPGGTIDSELSCVGWDWSSAV